jgi:lipoyl-dependent peroxiredoxin
MVRKATAVWKGSLKEGEGNLETQSGVIKTGYNFRQRFGEDPGTNPEELIAAAHAGCFSMALSGQLGEAGITAESIETVSAVTMEPVNGTPTLTKIHLTCVITAPGADKDAVLKAADNAKAGCPISRVLRSEITLETTVNN